MVNWQILNPIITFILGTVVGYLVRDSKKESKEEKLEHKENKEEVEENSEEEEDEPSTLS